MQINSLDLAFHMHHCFIIILFFVSFPSLTPLFQFVQHVCVPMLCMYKTWDPFRREDCGESGISLRLGVTVPEVPCWGTLPIAFWFWDENFNN